MKPLEVALDEITDYGTGPASASTVAVSHGPAYLCGRLLGEILTQTAQLPPEKLEQALAEQREKGGRLGEILVALKAVTETQVLEALAFQLDFPFMGEIDSDKV